MHNDVAYDNTAIWLHVASGVRGRADRIGRLFPALVLGIPVVLLGSVVSAYIYGHWNVLGGLIGVSSALLFAGLGFSSLISARFPYPVVRPGDSPFAQPQSVGATTAVVQSIAFPAALIPAAPAIVFAWLGFFVDAHWFMASLIAGVSLGILALVIGVWIGSVIFDRRGPELVSAAVRG
jgi:ABC-2 type transport system permease protein